MTVIEDRAALFNNGIVLERGSHARQDAYCVMEAVAYVAGEPWSDHPQCASPVLTTFMVNWNDQLDDETRQRLKPYIPRLVGTRSTPEVESARSWLACDWLVRTFTPAWLRLAGLVEDATALEALPELTASELANAVMPTIRKAKEGADAAWDAVGAAAWAAAWAAVGDAAWDAAGVAAGVAAWAAAGDAAGDAAGVAVGDAAWAAAWVAVGDAVGVAAGDALQPTVLELQESAFDLLDRMIAFPAPRNTP